MRPLTSGRRWKLTAEGRQSETHPESFPQTHNMDNMDNMDNLFHPSLAAALLKLDPEDGEQIMEYFKTHALLSREKALLQASVREQKKLLVENGKLKNDIQQLKNQLQDKRRAAKALVSVAPPPPGPGPAPSTSGALIGATAAAPGNPPASVERQRGRRGGRKDLAPPPPPPSPLGAEPPLDLRVGRILSSRSHPLDEALSVQQVELGEDGPRTVVSRLGGAEGGGELQGSLAVLLCSIRVSKKRGVASRGRLLVGHAPDGSTELVAPPPGSAPGDRVTVGGRPGNQPEPPGGRGLWEGLKVDGRGVATYLGAGLQVKGKGLCRTPSLCSCPIR
ncbi:aminoacyl tRNA synthase complex-interacting multifunctional protein 1-like [Menidia menidia]